MVLQSYNCSSLWHWHHCKKTQFGTSICNSVSVTLFRTDQVCFV